MHKDDLITPSKLFGTATHTETHLRSDWLEDLSETVRSLVTMPLDLMTPTRRRTKARDDITVTLDDLAGQWSKWGR